MTDKPTVIVADDDFTHPVGPEPTFNESMYFQFSDASSGLAGFLRLANRPNEGRGERTVCLYLPDGTLAFGFARPAVASNDRMDAGGLSVEIAVPMQRLQVRFDGPVSLLADPRALIDPKRALGASPTADSHIDLQYTALAPAYGGSFDGDGEGASFAPNHYEQLAAVTGTVRIGDSATPVSGYGLRDHSWGPRSWQAPWFYRWIHGTAADQGFMVAYFGEPDGSSRSGGFVWDGTAVHTVREAVVSTVRDAEHYQETVRVEAIGDDRRWNFEGHALASAPLRHRSSDGGATTRIIESTVRWTDADGRVLNGMAEYLDQLRDDRPVGLHV
ncbi:DUF7065 domain-containing protein [[Mycobacterium] wendilense]|uniref:Hydroxyneurosporene synthase (CrtC) n=1 Tax=[Mycobacterium] wendilense TaxID=3064284 RepID=A0ABM9MBA1_9MYCO|nr:hypothetical protein [Mycolicibacterium sp. MU0050]CAJ1581022.1 hypothetical protein MU0050_001327 [Mycolicibacterium sp. MU0050]